MTYAAFDHGSWRCYRIVNGLYRQFIGCRHLTPRSAVAHRYDLDDYVSPLRREAHADPGPLLGSGQSGFSPEPRSRGSRLVGQAGE